MANPTDGLFSKQWYLYNRTAGEYDLNVLGAWTEFTGKGIKIADMDNGFDYTHSDLSPNYDTANDEDYSNEQAANDAKPFYSDESHGTATMGIIGAARNGSGVVGVAYDATLLGARISFGLPSADAWRAQYVAAVDGSVAKGASVINMSFGGGSDFDKYNGYANTVMMQTAIDDALADGRGGLGTVLVKSAGNSRATPVDVNHQSMDGYSKQTIVAAVDRSGYVSEYSSYGQPILISAFGSPISGQIYTTDRQGLDGYDPGNYTSTFNGTSAAAPMVSGVVALMLQANADLGWRDVQSVLGYSARHVGSAINGESMSGDEDNLWTWNGANNWNGGALHHSADYGYGLVDARAAVRLAESWIPQSTSANETIATLDLTNTTTLLPDANLTGTTFSGTMSQSVVMERVTVSLDFQSAKLQDIEVYLKGPDGTERRLLADAGGFGTYDGIYTFHSQAFRGGTSTGSWSVRVVDDFVSYANSVRDIVIRAYGSSQATNDSYYFTNEFSNFTSNHSKMIKDTDGGAADVLNVSAVSLSSIIDLTAGTGRIDGVAVTISGIEDISSGEGNDILKGNAAGNDIAGCWGYDTMTGAGGADTFIYRSIYDSRYAPTHDIITDYSSDDVIDLSDIDTKTAAGDQGFKWVGKVSTFSGAATEMHFIQVDKTGTANDRTFIEADMDGNKTADFQIELIGLTTLSAGDIFL